MSAVEEFCALLETTEVMKEMIRSLREEPANLLGDIFRQYEETGHPVPDHRLQLAGYMSQAAIKVLLSAGLIGRLPGGTLSLYSYVPTDEGLKQHENLKTDGFYKSFKKYAIHGEQNQPEPAKSKTE